MKPASEVFPRVNRNDGALAEHHGSWRCLQQVSLSSGTRWPCGSVLPSTQVSSTVLLLSVFQTGMQNPTGHTQLACAALSCPGLLRFPSPPPPAGSGSVLGSPVTSQSCRGAGSSRGARQRAWVSTCARARVCRGLLCIILDLKGKKVIALSQFLHFLRAA